MPFKSSTISKPKGFAGIALATALSISASTGTAQSTRASVATGKEMKFTDYTTQPYTGVRRSPSFSGAKRDYRLYQSEIRAGFANNPLFAGHYVLIGVFCGTGCMLVYVGDVATGRISDFPLGGEDNYMLKYDTRPTSRLVKVTWNQMTDSGSRCIKEELVLSGSTFTRRKIGETNRLCSW